EPFDEDLRPLVRERAAASTEPDGEHQQVRELGGEALGRRDADLGAGVRVEDGVRHARNRAVDDVRDGEELGALRLRLASRDEGVERLARLAHGDDEISLADDGATAPEFAPEL